MDKLISQCMLRPVVHIPVPRLPRAKNMESARVTEKP